MADTPIRVLLADDSPLVLNILQRILSESSDIEVVGTAADGQEAFELVKKLDPDVVCTDLHMPVMNGLQLTRKLMEHQPRPILVISTAVQEEDTENVFELLRAGALDVFPKPRAGTTASLESVSSELISKIRVLSGVRVLRKRWRKQPSPTPTASDTWVDVDSGPDYSAEYRARKHFTTVAPTSVKRMVAIGASTGGPQALRSILWNLPPDFPAPILCVQHIQPGFLGGLVEWLDTRSPLRVKIAAKGERPVPGTAYFAPDDVHLEVDSRGRLVMSKSEPFTGHRPSVTTAFCSVAAFYGAKAIGVLLTGMGRDGAEGLQAISQAGGVTIAQDEKSCIIFGMPKRAIELGAAQQVLPVADIASRLMKVCSD